MNLTILGFLFILVVQSLQQEITNLKFVASLFRHGARGPLYHNLNAESEFNSFYWGQLTPTGQRQHYVLGQTMRERYIENSDLGLQTNYNHSQIYVRSTDVNRTINSAISQLSGLYPAGSGPWLPEDLSNFLSLPPYKETQQANIGQTALPYNFQNIPVHNVPKPKDYLLSPTNENTCMGAKNYQAEFKKSEEMKNIINEVNEHYKDVMQQFTDLFQMDPPMSFTDIVEQYWDTLIADKFNGQIFEKYDQITKEMWEGLKELDSLWWTTYQSGSPQFVKAGVSRVLQSWVQLAEVQLGMQKVEEYKNLKYVMYSAHDDNVVNMQIALNLMNYECLWQKFTTGAYNQQNCFNRAYYASQVIFELYQDGEGYENAFVKFMYDGEYVAVCESGEIECPYLDFKQQVANYIYVDGEFEGWFEGTLQIDEICQYQVENQQIEESITTLQGLQTAINNNGLALGFWISMTLFLSASLIIIVRKYSILQQKAKKDKKGFQQLDNEGFINA